MHMEMHHTSDASEAVYMYNLSSIKQSQVSILILLLNVLIIKYCRFLIKQNELISA